MRSSLRCAHFGLWLYFLAKSAYVCRCPIYCRASCSARRIGFRLYWNLYPHVWHLYVWIPLRFPFFFTVVLRHFGHLFYRPYILFVGFFNPVLHNIAFSAPPKCLLTPKDSRGVGVHASGIFVSESKTTRRTTSCARHVASQMIVVTGVRITTLVGGWGMRANHDTSVHVLTPCCRARSTSAVLPVSHLKNSRWWNRCVLDLSRNNFRYEILKSWLQLVKKSS